MPTSDPVESDGTLRWSSTTMVLVRVRAEGVTGVGYSYTTAAAAELVRDKLAQVVRGAEPLAVRQVWDRMWHGVRNLGRPGVVANAIAAVDTALWDLKGKLLDLPLADLLGRVREGVPVYGSGGFTSEPSLHAALACALPGIRHLEWFWDHVRIESEWFDGVPALRDGRAVPDPGRPGLGLVPREDALARHAV
ncbi:MAG: hypothetical protein R3F59_08350 [Myxococcota bacterium]